MKNILYLFLALISLITFQNCNEPVYPKPNGLLRLEHPKRNYIKINEELPYSFEKQENTSNILKKNKKWINIKYKNPKATLYMTYYDVNKNLNTLLRDAQKLTYEHAIKASEILPNPFVNSEKNVYGMLYEIKGNSATNLQFYLTDSIKHFVTGSVYFEMKPNYDSIYPSIAYLRKDMMHLFETFEWEK